jgi:hypothetical protein
MCAIMLASSTPTPTPYPVVTGTGHVSGRIKMANGQGAMGATVVVVNAGNFDYTYGSAVTDDYGFYNIDTTGISADPIFPLMIHKDGYADAYSVTFALPSGGNVMINLTDNSLFPTPSPAPTPTPQPTPSPVPTPTQSPAPTSTPSPVPTWKYTLTEDPATPTPHPTTVTATGTQASAASSTPRRTPGFEAVIALVSLAGVIGYKKLR